MSIDLTRTRVLRSSEALAFSSGAVMRPDSYNYRTMLPERRGLYCEEIFGLVNLSVEIPQRSGIVRRALRLDADERKDYWGHIELPEPVPHPLETDAVLAQVLVVPPWFRRFARRTAEESRRVATERRKELMAMIQDEDWIGDCRDGTDRPDKLLVEEGLESEADIDTVGPTWIEPTLNGQYRAVVNDSHRLSGLIRLGAPKELVDEQRRSLGARVAWLFEEVLRHQSGLGDALALRALSLSL